MKNVYETCPVFENDHWLLRFVEKSDCQDLLAVYGDKKALLVAKDGVSFNGYWIYK